MTDDSLTLEWIRQGYGLPPLDEDGKINRRVVLEKLAKENRNIKLKVKRKPQINKAHWIIDNNDHILDFTYWCSACGYETKKISKYCPSCGSNMEEN